LGVPVAETLKIPEVLMPLPLNAKLYESAFATGVTARVAASPSNASSPFVRKNEVVIFPSLGIERYLLISGRGSRVP
jgi:hypothetical protein